MRIARNTCLPEQTEQLLANLRKAQGLWIPSACGSMALGSVRQAQIKRNSKVGSPKW